MLPLQNRGIVLRLLTSLCDEREASRDVKKISVAISYAEFISTRIKDLLRNAFVEKINVSEVLLLLQITPSDEEALKLSLALTTMASPGDQES